MSRFTPRGRPYRRLREIVLRRDGHVCHLCGHEGATEVDHLLPAAVRPDLAMDARNLAAAHGSSAPCPICGRACNQKRAGRPIGAPPPPPPPPRDPPPSRVW